MATHNTEAYELFLRGRAASLLRTPASFRSAIGFFEQALRIDPDYADAMAGIAEVYALMGYYRQRPAHEVFPRAEAMARRALAIDSTLAAPNAALAFVEAWYRFDWREAESRFRRTLESNPSYTSALVTYGLMKSALGRADLGVELLNRAVARDPLVPLTHRNLAIVLAQANRPLEARAALNRHRAR